MKISPEPFLKKPTSPAVSHHRGFERGNGECPFKPDEWCCNWHMTDAIQHSYMMLPTPTNMPRNHRSMTGIHNA